MAVVNNSPVKFVLAGTRDKYNSYTDKSGVIFFLVEEELIILDSVEYSFSKFDKENIISSLVEVNRRIGNNEDDITQTNLEIVRVKEDVDGNSNELSSLFSDLGQFKLLKGQPEGLAELDVTGKVPSSQLPSYVDDVVEFDSLADFPTHDEAERDKIYVALDTNKIYRWGGTKYVEISSSLVLGTTSTTAYSGDKGQIAYNHSTVKTGNPHNVTKANVGLGNVDNTKDIDKPVSIQQEARIQGSYDDMELYVQTEVQNKRTTWVVL